MMLMRRPEAGAPGLSEYWSCGYHLAFGGSNANAVQPDIGLASAASFVYGVLLIAFSVVQVVVLRSLAKRRGSA